MADGPTNKLDVVAALEAFSQNPADITALDPFLDGIDQEAVLKTAQISLYDALIRALTNR